MDIRPDGEPSHRLSDGMSANTGCSNCPLRPRTWAPVVPELTPLRPLWPCSPRHASLPIPTLPISAWRRLYPSGTLRPLQETALAIVETGQNLLLVARTGGGKSLVYLLAAAARWAAAVQAGAACPPIALVVVPLVALGENQEDSANRYLSDLHARGLLGPRTAKALFVFRNIRIFGDQFVFSYFRIIFRIFSYFRSISEMSTHGPRRVRI